jgi:hypothetical protein
MERVGRTICRWLEGGRAAVWSVQSPGGTRRTRRAVAGWSLAAGSVARRGSSVDHRGAAGVRLIWREVCQGERHDFPAFAGRCGGGCGRLGGWRSGVLCATRVRLICAGLGCRRTMVRRGVPLSNIGRGLPCWGRVAHRRIAGSPRVPGRHRPGRRDECCRGVGSLDLADRPAEPGELAGGGNGDDRATLGALFEAGPGAVQPPLG